MLISAMSPALKTIEWSKPAPTNSPEQSRIPLVFSLDRSNNCLTILKRNVDSLTSVVAPAKTPVNDSPFLVTMVPIRPCGGVSRQHLMCMPVLKSYRSITESPHLTIVCISIGHNRVL